MECDECTVCYTLFAVDDEKPIECAYYQMEKCSEDLRPDKCGVIFEKIADDIYLGTIEPTQESISPQMMGQIGSFAKHGISTIFIHRNIKKPYIYPANKDIIPQDIWNKFMKFRENN